MEEPVKYKTGGVPRRPHLRRYDLGKNGTIAKIRGIVQMYRVGGGDLGGMYLDHENSPPLHHHTVRRSTWFQTGAGDRDSKLGIKFGPEDSRDLTRATFPYVLRSAEGLQLTRLGKVHGDTQGLTKETTTAVLERSGSGTEGGEVLWQKIQDGERSDPGRTGIPYSF